MASMLDQHEQQIRDWAAQRIPAAEMARQLGCSAVLVQKAMRRWGIPPMQPGEALLGRKIDRPSRLDPHVDQIRTWTEAGWRIGRIAKELGCSKQTVWNAMEKHGIPRHPKHSCPGDVNPAWKGGRYFDDDGYVLIYAPDHPYADKARRVREHRLVMEAHLGRFLLPTEVVDHNDGERAHNNLSNLTLYASNAEHLAATLKGRIPNWTPAGRERIRQGNLRAELSWPLASPAASETDAHG